MIDNGGSYLGLYTADTGGNLCMLVADQTAERNTNTKSIGILCNEHRLADTMGTVKL